MKAILFLAAFFIFFNSHANQNDEIKKEMYACFRMKEIKVNVDYDRIQWSPSESFTDVCLFGLRVFSGNEQYTYLTRRWRSPAYCKKFMKEWGKLKKENKTVCIAAYLSAPEKVKYQGKEVLEKSGFWEVIKSENWCHTYFMGNCQGIPNSVESF